MHAFVHRVRLRAASTSLLLFLAAMISIASDCRAIESRSQWDEAFRLAHPAQDPCLADPGEYPGDLYAWHGHYWIRAYLSMADTYGDTKYLDKAVALIDRMLFYRDDARHSRGELDPRASPYESAPPSFLAHRDRAAPGWRRNWRGKDRVEVITDGMITQAIMRFVVLVHDDPRFGRYRGMIRRYLPRVEETVSIWDPTFAYDRFAVPGSYWFPQTDGTRGLSSTEVPFNQSAAMATTLLLLDHVKGGVPEYRKKAMAVLDFWRRRRREVREGTNAAYDWNYYLRTREFGDEDFTHSHIDLSFFVTAHRYGMLTTDEMKRLATTFTEKIHKGNGDVAGHIDGSGSGDGYYAAFDWIDLARIDPRILSIAKAVYRKQYRAPSWSRPFLGWAEILRWSAILHGRGPKDDSRKKGKVGKNEQGAVHRLQPKQG